MLGESIAPEFKFRVKSWPTLVFALLVVQVILSLTLKQGARLVVFCETSYFVLLLIASGAAALNAVRSGQAVRLFWSLLAVAFALWAVVPCVSMYYGLLPGRIPPFIFDTPPLFLHIVFLIGAVAARPHLRLPAHRPYRTTLNFLMMLLFLTFAYAYFLFPYTYTDRASLMILHFETIYFAENMLLLVILGTLIRRAQPPWKSIYAHLFAASALYALGSMIANIVWALKDPSGDLLGTNFPSARGLLGLFFTGSIAWFAGIGLQGRKHAWELAKTVQVDTSDPRPSSVLAMAAVIAIPLTGLLELFRSDEPFAARVIRLLIVFVAMLFLSVTGFIRDYLSNRELASDVGLANDRLRLAMESGKSVGWDWDIKSGQESWFGDLQTMFGIASATYAGHVEDFLSYVHPDDREQVGNAQTNSMRNRTPYASEFRIVWPDGTLRYAAATGKCYYSPDGEPERMVGVALDVTDRKRAEQTLRESEERFRLVANTAPVLIWMSGTDKLCTFFNKGWLDFRGQPMEHEVGEGWAAGVHPDDLERCLNIYTAAFDNRVDFEMEYRLRRFDGKYRWIVDYGVPRFESDGTFCGYIGSCVDITDRKATEESLEELSGRLINAQEAERKRIARELHDDFSQRLALQGIRLGQLLTKLPESVPEGREKVKELLKTNFDLSRDMHALSHQLHSSTLEHVGLASALKGLCDQVSRTHKIRVDFTGRDVPSEIPKDVALCLFRVAQEALSNVVKHSQAEQARAELFGGNNQIRLRILDAGLGFEPVPGNTYSGIGLVGMRERLRLVGGVLAVESSPKRGTEILGIVPLFRSAN
jgi:PAS domain S-box-containing protein